MNYTPTTELEAVNEMLGMVGEAPVNSLEVSGLVDAGRARTLLHTTSRSIQSRCWNFNTEDEYPLLVDEEGYINLPANTLRVDATDPTIKVTQRGSRLYDLDNHTYIFNECPKLRITFFLEFEVMPEPARRYITLNAGRLFQTEVQGSDSIHSQTYKDEEEALAVLRDLEADNGDYSMLPLGLRR
jgi:hypothetical protein